MGRNSYDDMLPEGYREKRSGSRGTSLIIAFIGVLITLIAIVIYLMFTPHDSSADNENVSASAVAVSVSEPELLQNEAAELRHSASDAAVEETPVREVKVSSGGNSDRLYSITEYEIQDGDTLESIAASFGVSVNTIVDVNGITDISRASAGTVLEIPSVDGTLYTVQPGDTSSSIADRMCPDATGEMLLAFNGLDSEPAAGTVLFIPAPGAVADYGITFLSPIENGKVIQDYNSVYMGGRIKGVVIAGDPGTAVRAAADGKIQGFPFDQKYGKGIVVYHDGGRETVYYGLESITVGTGDVVRQGEPLGSIGTSSIYFGEPAVLFEIRQAGIEMDPGSFLGF